MMEGLKMNGTSGEAERRERAIIGAHETRKDEIDSIPGGGLNLWGFMTVNRIGFSACTKRRFL